MDDSLDFMEVAKAVETTRKGTRPQGQLVKGPDSEEKEGKSSGSLTQYADIGDAFLPTSNTIKSLPADCYTLGVLPSGAVVYKRQKLITDSLLRLPDSRSDEVVKEVERFWELKERFSKFGFSHKRGFLLYGPPGSGKTSTVAIIVNDMVKRGGAVMLGEAPYALRVGLKSFRDIEPDRPLVVILEDLDAIIYHYGESDILSILDGESQVENVVFIATTNYPEKLDGRIINRPSRFDKIVKIGMPNAQAREMYLRSKLETIEAEGINLVEATDGLSIAHIKELIVSVYCQENPVKETLERLKSMKRGASSDREGGILGI